MGVLVSVSAASAFAAGQVTREEAVDASESFLRSYAQVRSNKNADELTANLFNISKTWLKKHNLNPTKIKVNGRRIDSIELIRWSPPKAYFIGLVNDNTPFAKLVFEVRREDDEITIVPEKISPENREWIEPYSYIVVPEAQRITDKDFIAYQNRISSSQNREQKNENQQRQARQMCEAQKQTCLASCGDRIGAFTSQGIASGEYARIGKCETSCRSIGCN